MRLVDIKNIKSVADVYKLIPQPMVVYHTTAEFEANENVNAINLVTDFPSLLTVFQNLKIDMNYRGLRSGSSAFQLLLDKNIWIKTIDEYIPTIAEKDSTIYYEMDANNNPIPTDGCYVKLLAILPLPAKVVLFTSSGMHNVGITKWAITAAVRTQFISEGDFRGKTTSPLYQERLDRLAVKVRPNTEMYKIVFALFHPSSAGFMNLHKAVRLSGSKLKQEHHEKILQSPSFRSAMIQVMKMILPQLKNEVHQQFPPEKMIGMLADAYQIAKDEKSVKQILEIFDKLKDVGYEEMQVTNDQTQLPQLPSIPQANLIGAATEVQPPIPTEEPIELNVADLQLDDKELAALRAETGTLESHIQLDFEEDAEESARRV